MTRMKRMQFLDESMQLIMMNCELLLISFKPIKRSKSYGAMALHDVWRFVMESIN